MTVDNASRTMRSVGLKALSARDHLAWIECKLKENKRPTRNNGDEIVIRDIPKNKEIEEIRTLFRSNGTLYYSDIVERTGISLRTVVEICDNLKTAGEIALDKSI